MNQLNLTPEEKDTGTRLDKFLSYHPLILSRSKAAFLIKNGHVTYNSTKTLKPSFPVDPSHVFSIDFPKEKVASDLTPYPLPLDVVFEDDDLILINKPAGLVVHPAPGHPNETLVNALIAHTDQLSMGFNEQRPGIVHRLDKDTSGLILVAKNDHAQQGLYKQFIRKEVARTYLAIVFGNPKGEEGTIESYFVRHPKDRKKFCSEKIEEGVEPKGKKAITHYQVLESSLSGLSLVKCVLETGRTHQIRVHMSEQLKCSIVGDVLYSSTGRAKTLKSLKLRALINKLNRTSLHAAKIEFNHPLSGERLQFKAPWPSELAPFTSAMGIHLDDYKL